MHIVQTYLLRLLIDPTAPGELRGAVEAISEPGGPPHPFIGEQGLLALLHQLAGQEGQAQGQTLPPDLES